LFHALSTHLSDLSKNRYLQIISNNFKLHIANENRYHYYSFHVISSQQVTYLATHIFGCQMVDWLTPPNSGVSPPPFFRIFSGPFKNVFEAGDTRQKQTKKRNL